MAKLNLVVLFGGKSTEHGISILSATGIVSQLDREKYTLSLVKIDMDNQWQLLDGTATDAAPKAQVSLLSSANGACLINVANGNKETDVDVIFPVLHGTFGEDGTIQVLIQNSQCGLCGLRCFCFFRLHG